MAPRLRKTSSSSSVDKQQQKKMKKSQKEMNNTSLAANKYAGIFGIFILLFGIIYLILFGRYVYKRRSGSPSALNQQNPNPFNFANLDMEAFKKAIKVDENGKVTFSQEDLEKLKEVFVDVNGNAQVPPKNLEEDNKETTENKETVEEVGNDESGANAEAQAQAQADAEATTDEKKKKTRMKMKNFVKNVV